MSDFKFIQSVVANGVHQVTKYQSESTGLLLVHADVKGPMVTGLIVIGMYYQKLLLLKFITLFLSFN